MTVASVSPSGNEAAALGDPWLGLPLLGKGAPLLPDARFMTSSS